MRKLFSFMVAPLDGYPEGPNGEFDWPNVDDEFNEYAVSQLNDVGALLFGRTTYQGMTSYWPTGAARSDDPLVADLMNRIPKVVFSKSLQHADWENTTLVDGDVAEVVTELKRQPGKDLAIFGSSDLTVSLLQRGLVDELRVMVNPVLLGAGRSLFAGLPDRVRLSRARVTAFSSGNVLLCYRPAT